MNINARKPAAIARVAMIPAICIFQAAHMLSVFFIYSHVFIICNNLSILLGLSALYSKTKLSIMIIISPSTFPSIKPVSDLMYITVFSRSNAEILQYVK